MAMQIKQDVPSSWYDARGRVESIKAIADILCGLQPNMQCMNVLEVAHLNKVAGLSSALQDIAALALKDIQNTEKALMEA